MPIADPGAAGQISAIFVDAFFLRCFAYDWLTRRSLHPAFVIAFISLLLDQAVQTGVVDWHPWIQLSNFIQHLVS
jgi:hypothetical protein